MISPKRVGIFDGKMSSLSGRASKFNRLSPSSSRRISVEEWPAHFSPFGGKRFPMGKATIWGKERVPSSRIEIKPPLMIKLQTKIISGQPTKIFPSVTLL